MRDGVLIGFVFWLGLLGLLAWGLIKGVRR